MLDEGHVVAGLDAEHSEQLHLLPGRREALAEALGKQQLAEAVSLTLGVGVDLHVGGRHGSQVIDPPRERPPSHTNLDHMGFYFPVLYVSGAFVITPVQFYHTCGN